MSQNWEPLSLNQEKYSNSLSKDIETLWQESNVDQNVYRGKYQA